MGRLPEKDDEAFERVVKDALDCDDVEVIAVDSEAKALLLALTAIGVSSGDEVCMASFAQEAAVSVVVAMGARPVFVGNEERMCNMDSSLLEDAIIDRIERTGKRPKAIIMTAAHDMPMEVHLICEVAFRYNIPIIDDASNVPEARYYGRRLGTFGWHGYGIMLFEKGSIATGTDRFVLVCEDKEYKTRIITLMEDSIRNNVVI